jgi:hypothetical protein
LKIQDFNSVIFQFSNLVIASARQKPTNKG